MRSTMKQQAAADGLKAGKSIKSALLDAGYSATTASLGKRALSGGIMRALGHNRRQFGVLGRISAVEQEEIVRGGLVFNSLTRSDKGVQSMKALGSDKRVSMFVPENVTGVVVIVPGQQAENLLKEEE